MKLCIISDFFIPHYNGGGERRYFEIAKRLVDRGHQVDVICMKIQGVDDYELIEGINVYHVGPEIKNPPYKGVSDFIHFTLSGFLWILKNDYDIIDSQQYMPYIPGFFGAKIKRLPVVGTIHDISSGKGDQWLTFTKVAPFIEKLLLRLPYDKIVTVSNHTKNALTEEYGVKPERIDLVHNGVDLKLVDSVTIDKRYKDSIIFVGRLAAHKHVDDLINVIKLLKEDYKDIYLKIIGNGIEKDNLIK
ncbi:MAG: glycosyltransferase family 4 protein, partial [Methanobacterium sp.]